MINQITPEDFINQLIALIPSIANDVLDEDYDGLFSLQIGVLTRYTQKIIDNNNLQTLSIIYKFIDEMIELGNHKVQNTVYTAYLEHLDFSANQLAYNQLPAKLKKAFLELKNYQESAMFDKELQMFLLNTKE
jgi:hypothetical protein